MSDPRSRETDDHDETFELDLEGKPSIRPGGTQSDLIEMPAGKGKTVNFVIGSILHRALLKNTPPRTSTKGRRK